jgi:hypothetical protein
MKPGNVFGIDSISGGLGRWLVRLVSLGLLSSLLLVPAGGSACWPLPGGRHLHIGWNEQNGNETATLTIFVHEDNESLPRPRSPSFSPIEPIPVLGVGEIPLPAVPLRPPVLTATLSWLLEIQWIVRRLPTPRPATPPPRLFVS